MELIDDVGSFLPPVVVGALVAALASFLLTPLVRRTALRFGVLDQPSARRINVVPMPRAGGIGVAAVFLAVAGAFLWLNAREAFVPAPVFLTDGHVTGLLAGAAAAAGLGVLDDLFDLRARWQMTFQVLLAIGAVALGITIESIKNPFAPGLILFPDWFAMAFTVFWIVGMMNSINWIDGLDGLSSGIAVIAAVTLGIISLTTQVGQPLVTVLCFVLAGALLGFLPWNFNPARIFPGTSGVQFIGFTLAVLSILGEAKVAVALLVLGVPIIDTFWIIVRRLMEGRSPFSPDRSHIHHRMLDLGLSHRHTVVLIYVICVLLALLALLLSGLNQLYAFLGVFVLFGLALFVPTRGGLRVEELEANAYEDAGPDRAAMAPAPESPGSTARASGSRRD